MIVVDVAEPERDHPRAVAAELLRGAAGDARALCGARPAAAGGGTAARGRGSQSLRATEDEKRAGEAAELSDERAPLHPMRIYGELAQMLDRNAIVIGDGGDFVSFAGRLVDSYEPGCWLDPGPFGCLGSGPGYALAAKLAHPDRQVVLLLGDGALGFAGMDFDTLVRHGVAVVGIGRQQRDLGARKAPDGGVVRLLRRRGADAGDAVRPGRRSARRRRFPGPRPRELRPRSSGVRIGQAGLVNVLTDPDVAYPRRSNLA